MKTANEKNGFNPKGLFRWWGQSFAARLLLIFTGLWFIISLVTGFTIYQVVSQSLEEKMGQQLLAMGSLVEKQLVDKTPQVLQPNLPGSSTRISTILQSFLDSGILQNITLLNSQGIILVDATGESIPGFKSAQLSDSALIRLKNKNSVLLPVYTGDFGTLHQSVFIPYKNGFILQVDASPRFLDILKQFRNYSLLLGLIGLILSAIVSALVAQTVLKPVSGLAHLARQVAVGHYPESHIRRSRSDELGQLENSLLIMADRIRAREEDLLRLKSIAEQQAEQMKEVAGGIAHEVRTPLVVIRGEAEWIQKNASENSAAVESVRKILGQVVALNHLVSRFLEYGKVFHLNREKINLETLIKNLEKNLKVPPTVIVKNDIQACAPVEVDATLLFNSLSNIVTNAVEAMPQGGNLILRVRQESSRALMEVEDSGPGISAEARANLFKPFFTTKANGTGLGLAFAQKVVQAHGGDLEILTGRSGGALFRISLPLTRG